jgi:hypothetical protein
LPADPVAVAARAALPADEVALDVDVVARVKSPVAADAPDGEPVACAELAPDARAPAVGTMAPVAFAESAAGFVASPVRPRASAAKLTIA